MPVVVKGLNEFRAGLRKAGRDYPKAVGKANQKIGEKIAADGRPAVIRLPSPGGHASAEGIRSSKKQNKAVIRLVQNNATGPILANVFGAKSHMVWGRRASGRGPWQQWIGRSWQPEDLYGLGPVIKDVADNFALDEYLDAVLDALAPAFPD